MANFNINNQTLEKQIDTGASVSVLNATTNKERQELRKSGAVLCTYSGELIAILGTIEVNVQYEDQQASVPLVVVEGNGPNLVGRDWLKVFKLKWAEIGLLSKAPTHWPILEKCPEVFQEGLGTLQNTTAKMYVDPLTQPKLRPRPDLYAMKGKVDKELSCLQQAGIIEPVQFSDWAAPVVPVLKGNGEVRICGDYKTTINQVAKLYTYPIPRIEDLYATFSGGKTFTKLYLSNAHLQLPLEAGSKQYTTINTHRGLFQFIRSLLSSLNLFQIFQFSPNLVANHTHISPITPSYCIRFTTHIPVPGGSWKDLAIQRNTRLLQAVSTLLSAMIPGAQSAENAAI